MKFYKISEFAKIVGKSSRTIREWDKLGLLKPHHKGQGGYRYYSEEQVNEALYIDEKKQSNLKFNLEKVLVYCAGKTIKEVNCKTNRIISFIDFDYKNIEVVRDINGHDNLRQVINGVIEGKITVLILYDKNELNSDAIVVIENICERFNCLIKYIY